MKWWHRRRRTGTDEVKVRVRVREQRTNRLRSSSGSNPGRGPWTWPGSSGCWTAGSPFVCHRNAGKRGTGPSPGSPGAWSCQRTAKALTHKLKLFFPLVFYFAFHPQQRNLKRFWKRRFLVEYRFDLFILDHNYLLVVLVVILRTLKRLNRLKMDTSLIFGCEKTCVAWKTAVMWEKRSCTSD